MVLKVRSAEEIDQHLQRPASIALIKRVGIARAKANGVFATEHKIALNRLLLKAYFGPKAFRGTQGRALKAISEFAPPHNETGEQEGTRQKTT